MFNITHMHTVLKVRIQQRKRLVNSL